MAGLGRNLRNMAFGALVAGGGVDGAEARTNDVSGLMNVTPPNYAEMDATTSQHALTSVAGRNWRDVVSFVPPHDMALPEGVKPSDLELSAGTKAKVSQALDEIYATPEGKALIDDIAHNSPNGTIDIWGYDDPNLGSHALVLDKQHGETRDRFNGRVFIGGRENRLQYPEMGSGQNGDPAFHDFSVQRLVMHELQHLNPNHKHSRRRGDERPDQFNTSPSKEAEAISATNAFMEKYYGEPARDPHQYDVVSNDGSPGLDVNPNYRGPAPAPYVADGRSVQIGQWRAERAAREAMPEPDNSLRSTMPTPRPGRGL